MLPNEKNLNLDTYKTLETSDTNKRVFKNSQTVFFEKNESSHFQKR